MPVAKRLAALERGAPAGLMDGCLWRSSASANARRQSKSPVDRLQQMIELRIRHIGQHQIVLNLNHGRKNFMLAPGRGNSRVNQCLQSRLNGELALQVAARFVVQT